MNRLQRIADPLVTSPPRPAPTIEALQARAAHRRDRRRRARLAALSLAVVVLLAGGVLTARRDQPTDVLAGPPATGGGTAPASADPVATTTGTASSLTDHGVQVGRFTVDLHPGTTL